MFHIDARREVFHDDRDVLFIVFKRMMKDYIEKTYYNHEIDCCDFNSNTCEMLAQEIYKEFELCKIN